MRRLRKGSQSLCGWLKQVVERIAARPELRLHSDQVAPLRGAANATSNTGTQGGTPVGPAVAKLVAFGCRTHAATQLSSGITFWPSDNMFAKDQHVLPFGEDEGLNVPLCFKTSQL